jgi:hypothetical protein
MGEDFSSENRRTIAGNPHRVLPHFHSSGAGIRPQPGGETITSSSLNGSAHPAFNSNSPGAWIVEDEFAGLCMYWQGHSIDVNQLFIECFAIKW